MDEKEEQILGRHLLALENIWICRGEVLRLNDWKIVISQRRYFKKYVYKENFNF